MEKRNSSVLKTAWKIPPLIHKAFFFVFSLLVKVTLSENNHQSLGMGGMSRAVALSFKTVLCLCELVIYSSFGRSAFIDLIPLYVCDIADGEGQGLSYPFTVSEQK